MRDGFYLRVHSMGSYGYPDDVYERNLWLKEGLVLTDDNRVLFRKTAFYISPNKKPAAEINGEPLYTGPGPDLRPSEPLPWFPFCVDGRWGYGNAGTGEIVIAPQYAFCDYHNEYFARYSTKGDFTDLKKECYHGAWGLYNDGLEEIIPPIYQHLSCVQNSVLTAKKDGRWGLLNCYGFEELPFQWDWMTFVKSCAVAAERIGGETRYTIFYEGQNYDYKGPPHPGDAQGTILSDRLATVTVPKKPRDDGLPCSCRLIQRGERWGVVDCVTGQTVEPVLSRQEAEKLFWEREDEWG